MSRTHLSLLLNFLVIWLISSVPTKGFLNNEIEEQIELHSLAK